MQPGRRAALYGLAVVMILAALRLVGWRDIPETSTVIGPLLVATAGTPLQVAGVAVLAVVAAAAMAIDAGAWVEGDTALRLMVVAVGGALGVLAAWDRRRRDDAQARTEEVADLGRRLQVSLEAGGMGAWVFDMASGITTWDERLEAMHGFEPGEFDGRFESWIERVHPDDRELLLAASDEAISRRESYEVPYRACLPDGSVRWLEARGEPTVRRRRVTGTAGVVTDVTERMTAETVLEQSRAEVRRAVHERNAINATLQRNLLPLVSVQNPAWSVATGYWPGESRLLVGGDFLDAVEVDGTLRFVIGDVAGHDATAAAVGAALRAGWRTAAFTSADPVAWIHVLHRLLRSETEDPECFATVCTGIATGSELTLVVAGHPPPIVVRPGSSSELVVRPTSPVGLGEDASSTAVTLDEPWALFLYTDGLIEGHAARGGPERLGSEPVARWLGEQVDPAGDIEPALLPRLLAMVEERHGGRLADDVAILAIARRGPAAG